jgi:hypothetical protein
MLDILNYVLHVTSVLLLILGIYGYKKDQPFTWLILAYCIYHVITDTLFGITAHYGIHNWFLKDYFLFPEWIITSGILYYILNKKKSTLALFIAGGIVLAICQIVREPNTYWPAHLSSILMTIASAFVWIYFIRTIGLSHITKLRRFWMLISITLLQSISSFVLLLYELVPMSKYDFLPSIIIATFHITVALSYAACIKACLCKQN